MVEIYRFKQKRSKKMKYTKRLEEEIWNINFNDENATKEPEVALEFLNSEKFRTFGEGLFDVVSKKYPEVDEENVVAKIKEYTKTNGVPDKEIAKSPNTLANWLKKDSRPKKGEKSRHQMFALAFALNLSVDETKYLFENVYLDRAFDYRKPKEIIFYFCLKNGKTWSDAERLIDEASKQVRQHDDKTIITRNMLDELNELNDEVALLAYLNNHGHNFEKTSVKAKKVFAQLLADAKKAALSEIETKRAEDKKGKWNTGEEVSNNFLYEIITNQKVSDKTGTKTIFKNANLPQEIKNRFPEANTLSNPDMTYEEIRKVIVLLHFYIYCINNADNTDYDEYLDEINNILDKCMLPEMYPGNPFDWLFLFSLFYADSPLVAFRGTVAEALHTYLREE